MPKNTKKIIIKKPKKTNQKNTKNSPSQSSEKPMEEGVVKRKGKQNIKHWKQTYYD